MTTEEKLQHFYEVSMDSARNEAMQELESYKAKLAEQLAEHKETKQRQAEFELKAESDSLKRQMNKSISTEQLQIKRKLSLKQQELKAQLFEEVKTLLKSFASSPEYLDYLEKKIKNAAAFAEEDEVHYYLSSSDAALQAELSARTGATIKVSKENFLGGIQAVIPAKNILIDNSISSVFEETKAKYTFDGGLMHE